MMQAAIDIGSNTVQLLIGEVANGQVVAAQNALLTTRLGQSATPGLLEPARIEATLQALRRYQQLISEAGVAEVRLVATAAVREAENRAEFLRQVAQQLGWQVAVLSGEQEAALSFLGAVGQPPGAATGELLVADVGGGSTELIENTAAGLRLQSLPLGAVRARQNGWEAAQIRHQLQQQGVKPLPGAALLGVGGSITTAAGLKLKLDHYQRQAVAGCRLNRADLAALLAWLEPLSLAERCAASPLLAERGQIIVEGLWIWQALLDLLALDGLRVSAGGILEGVLLQAAMSPQ